MKRSIAKLSNYSKLRAISYLIPSLPSKLNFKFSFNFQKSDIRSENDVGEQTEEFDELGDNYEFEDISEENIESLYDNSMPELSFKPKIPSIPTPIIPDSDYDLEKSADLQDLVMGCLSQLEEKQIKEFLRIASTAKSSMVYNDKNSRRKGFINKSHNAPKLAEIIERVDLYDLKPEIFKSNPIDFHDDIELRCKITKYRKYSQEKVPIPSFLVKEFDNSPEEQADNGESNLIERASEMIANSPIKLESGSIEDKIEKLVNSSTSMENFEDQMFIRLKQEIMSQRKKREYLPSGPPVQANDEVLILKQAGFREVPELHEKSNFVYLCGLPFSIPDIANAEDKIKEAFNGKIKNLSIFPFSEFLEESQEYTLNKSYQNIHENLLFNNGNQNTTERAPPNTEFDQESYEKSTRKTKKILERVEDFRSKKKNRSYAILEFNSYQDKLNALSEDLRIFGIHIMNKLCNVEDADYKRTLVINNLRWGSQLKKIQQWLNSVFIDLGQENLKIEEITYENNRTITRFFILLRFNSFFESAIAQEILNQRTYEDRSLKAHHFYGNLRVSQGQYHELLDSDKSQNPFQRAKNLRLNYRVSIDDQFEEFAQDHNEYEIDNEQFYKDLERELHEIGRD